MPLSLPRVLPAASLKLLWLTADLRDRIESSAGPTRGLIEAALPPAAITESRSLPRVLPAASLKRFIR